MYIGIIYFSLDSTDKEAFSIIDPCISTFFVLEVGLRMYAMTPKSYFSKKHWFNTIDFAIVIMSVAGSVAEIIMLQFCESQQVQSN